MTTTRRQLGQTHYGIRWNGIRWMLLAACLVALGPVVCAWPCVLGASQVHAMPAAHHAHRVGMAAGHECCEQRPAAPHVAPSLSPAHPGHPHDGKSCCISSYRTAVVTAQVSQPAPRKSLYAASFQAVALLSAPMPTTVTAAFRHLRDGTETKPSLQSLASSLCRRGPPPSV